MLRLVEGHITDYVIIGDLSKKYANNFLQGVDKKDDLKRRTFIYRSVKD